MCAPGSARRRASSDCVVVRCSAVERLSRTRPQPLAIDENRSRAGTRIRGRSPRIAGRRRAPAARGRRRAMAAAGRDPGNEADRRKYSFAAAKYRVRVRRERRSTAVVDAIDRGSGRLLTAAPTARVLATSDAREPR